MLMHRAPDAVITSERERRRALARHAVRTRNLLLSFRFYGCPTPRCQGWVLAFRFPLWLFAFALVFVAQVSRVVCGRPEAFRSAAFQAAPLVRGPLLVTFTPSPDHGGIPRRPNRKRVSANFVSAQKSSSPQTSRWHPQARFLGRGI